jgi:hypothetical protein
MEELRKALQDMICLAGSLNEDDPWFGERRNAEERIKKAKTILEQSLTEEVTDKEVENFIQSLPWDYKDTANSGFGLEDAKCLVGGNIRNFWQWIKNKQFKLTEETEEGFKEWTDEKCICLTETFIQQIFTHYKLIKREK